MSTLSESGRSSASLREVLASDRPLVADGATGTMLQKAGLANGESPERWNLEKPAAIHDLAAGYIAAGSDIIYTNTFGGNRIRLRHAGLDAAHDRVNLEAVRIAREAIAASGRRVFLVASIGPTGEMLDPYGDLSDDDAREAFAGQCAVLAAAGVDGFACETFTAIEEAVLATTCAREAAGDRPVFASMAFDQSGFTMMGVTPEDAIAALFAAGADVVGANCSVGPEVVGPVIGRMAAARPGSLLLAKPNAGMPVVMADGVGYPVAPAEIGSFAARMAGLGARVLGGCCGTTPAHIRAIRESVNAPA